MGIEIYKIYPMTFASKIRRHPPENFERKHITHVNQMYFDLNINGKISLQIVFSLMSHMCVMTQTRSPHCTLSDSMMDFLMESNEN